MEVYYVEEIPTRVDGEETDGYPDMEQEELGGTYSVSNRTFTNDLCVVPQSIPTTWSRVRDPLHQVSSSLGEPKG